MLKQLVVWPVILLLLGCAGQIEVEPVSADHPASPDAPEAAPPAPSTTLQQEPGDAPRTESQGSAMGGKEHLGHTINPDPQGAEGDAGNQDRGTDQVGEDESRDAAGTSVLTSSESEITYTCRMHPEVAQTKPGGCPKCGTSLIKKEDLE